MIRCFTFEEIRAVAFLNPADRQGRRVVAFEHDSLTGAPVVTRVTIDEHGVYCPACGQVVDYLVQHPTGRGLRCPDCCPAAAMTEDAA